jgi:predicted transcriptional regulator
MAALTPRPKLLAAQIMRRKLFTLRTEQSVYEAIEVLLSKGISGAPVIDADHNLIGLLSEKDAIQALLTGIYDRLPTPTVGSTMRRKLTTISADTDLLTIAHLFIKHAFRRLPVVDGDKLIGQISRRDLLAAMNGMLKGENPYEAASLFLSVSRDRSEAPI